MTARLKFVCCVVFAIFSTGFCAAQSAPEWRPIADEVYLQEVTRQIATDWPVVSLAVYAGRLYAATGSALYAMPATGVGDFARVDSPASAATQLHVTRGRLWALTADGVHHYAGEEWRSLGGFPEGTAFYTMFDHLGALCISASNGIYAISHLAVDGQTLYAERFVERSGGNPAFVHAASYGETVYGTDGGRLFLHDLSGYDGINVSDWGRFPETELREILSMGSRLYLATGDGLGVLQGMTLSMVRGAEGLPYEDLTALAKGFDGDLWIGTTRGAIRYTDGAYHYFAGNRYLPNDRVNAIAVHNRTVYIGTPQGVGIIEYDPYTLLKKAAYYERWLEEWGQKRLGFTHKLEWDGPTGTWMREVSDNDAGWSTHYLTAKCFEYAVTGDEAARNEAVYLFESLKWCEEITPIDGFPARAIWANGETGHRTTGGSGGYAAEWNPTPDEKWAWKGDTSSDETDAHYYATAIFYELAARGAEKEKALEHLTRVTNHIIDNGWVLRDLDGKPTVWGHWEPEYLQRPKGYYARGLNGLEILSYVKTAETLTRNAKFSEAYKKLLGYGYHNEVLRQKLVFPPDDVFHSDDRLAFYAYYNIVRYETDPHLRSIYRRSFDRSWEVERIERNPWFNIMYGALTGNDCDEAEAVAHLREWPLDLIRYSYYNSHRADLRTPEGYSDHANITRIFSPRETDPKRWSDNPRWDGGSGGREVVDPAGWLDAYWMGRYYGIIEAPTTDDPALVSVEKREGYRPGAIPYDGPPRPF